MLITVTALLCISVIRRFMFSPTTCLNHNFRTELNWRTSSFHFIEVHWTWRYKTLIVRTVRMKNKKNRIELFWQTKRPFATTIRSRSDRNGTLLQRFSSLYARSLATSSREGAASSSDPSKCPDHKEKRSVGRGPRGRACMEL